MYVCSNTSNYIRVDYRTNGKKFEGSSFLHPPTTRSNCLSGKSDDQIAFCLTLIGRHEVMSQVGEARHEVPFRKPLSDAPLGSQDDRDPSA
jgi:hypothetical protein